MQKWEWRKTNNREMEKYVENIRPYLQDMIDDLKSSGEGKIYLTMKTNIVSTTGSLEYCQMQSKSDNSRSWWFCHIRYHWRTFRITCAEASNRFRDINEDSNFVFDGIDGLHYKCNKISLNHDRSYINSSQWLKNKKATINPKNNSHAMCFRYVPQ